MLAGGLADSQSLEFSMLAELGSPTFGLCSNPFLDREFKTVRYELSVKVAADGMSFEYDEDTILQDEGEI